MTMEASTRVKGVIFDEDKKHAEDSKESKVEGTVLNGTNTQSSLGF